MASSTQNGELSIVNPDGNVIIIYPKTYASNVLMSNGTTVENAINSKASSSHTHDSRYYTEAEVNNLLNTKANTGVIPVNPSSTSSINIWLEV